MKGKAKNKIFVIQEDGFSLVEILVTITVASLLIGFASGVYLIGQRYFINWQEGIKLQNELHAIAHGISEDIFKSEQIKDFSNNGLTLVMDDRKERIYQVKDDKLFRNGKDLLAHSISLVSFNISVFKKNIPGPEKNRTRDISMIGLSLALTNGTDTLSTTRRIHLREPSNWSSINN